MPCLGSLADLRTLVEKIMVYTAKIILQGRGK